MPVSRQLIKQIYRKRQPWSHKGDFGKLLVVGGSALYSGSPMFNALAAYRAGCDLVKIAAPEKAAAAIKSYSPDMIAYPLKGDYLSKNHVAAVLSIQKDADAMVIGGGLGRGKQTLSAIRSILAKTKIPTVIDADAIYAVKSLNKNFVLTPHSYEFCVLSKKKLSNNLNDRIAKTKELALRMNCTVLLKGHIDVISDGVRTTTNNTGSPFMTKGGFGDTLAGICGALLARKLDSYHAACAAAYINGKAGELAARKFGEGMLATDLLWDIPNAIR